MSAASSCDLLKLPLPPVRYLTSPTHGNMATAKLSLKSATTNINCSFNEDDAVTLENQIGSKKPCDQSNTASRASGFVPLESRSSFGKCRPSSQPDGHSRGHYFDRCICSRFKKCEFLRTISCIAELILHSLEFVRVLPSTAMASARAESHHAQLIVM